MVRKKKKTWQENYTRHASRNKFSGGSRGGLRVCSYLPLSPVYFIFMGNFKKYWVNWTKRTPLGNLNPFILKILDPSLKFIGLLCLNCRISIGTFFSSEYQIIYIASKVKHHYNNYHIGVYYIRYSLDGNLVCDLSLPGCLLDPQYRLIHNTAWSTIMPFDGIVQDLRCPVYTSPIWGYAQKGYFTAFVVVHVLYCY